MNYRIAYSIGFHPWEDAATDPPFAEKISELFDREETGREPPFGTALDLGTGSGIWGIKLAKRGWQVTGIDIIDTALQRAHDWIQSSGIDMRLVHGDVTALRAAGVGAGFRLVLDTGTFHGLSDAQREAMGREVSAVAAADATVLLLVWPKRRRPLIRGASRSEIETAFPGWNVTDVEASHFRPPKILELLLKPDEHWYRLRRKCAAQIQEKRRRTSGNRLRRLNGHAESGSKEEVMSVENKALVRRWFEEVWNKGHVAAIDEMFAAHGTVHGLGMDMHGPASFKPFHAAYREAFPDVKLELEDMIAEGDKVAVRWTATATHQGKGLGFAATGRQVRFNGMVFMRVQGGKLVEGWNNFDQLGLLQQLGIVNLPG
jgi:steroid delta-isomerase-like uncharacterized protein